VTAVTRESLSNKNVHTVTMFCYRTIGSCQLHDVTDQPLQMSRLLVNRVIHQRKTKSIEFFQTSCYT